MNIYVKFEYWKWHFVHNFYIFDANLCWIFDNKIYKRREITITEMDDDIDSV